LLQHDEDDDEEEEEQEEDSQEVSLLLMLLLPVPPRADALPRVPVPARTCRAKKCQSEIVCLKQREKRAGKKGRGTAAAGAAAAVAIAQGSLMLASRRSRLDAPSASSSAPSAFNGVGCSFAVATAAAADVPLVPLRGELHISHLDARHP
jgi:hypothetical protein